MEQDNKMNPEWQEIIANHIKADMEEVLALLGRPFSIAGKVVTGKELGRKLEVPTANFSLDRDKCIPPRGVYITSAEIDGQTVYGVTNIGVRPTVDHTDTPNVETHFLDYEADLYDQEIELNFHHFVRPEQKFDSIDELKARIDMDIACARKYRK